MMSPTTKLQRQHQTASGISRKFLGSVLASCLLVGMLDAFLAQVNLAQEVPFPAESAKPEPTTPEPPTQGRPAVTFGVGTDIPQGYSPPAFNEQRSREFNLYRLDIGDSISVTVINFPEFNFSSVIDADGKVIVPILGRISVVGLTLDEVETKIGYELSLRYLKEEPEVIATLAGTRPAQIALLGEVVRPGFYPVTPGTPLNAVLTQAGGSGPKADLRSIIVRRQLIDGSVLEEQVDLYTPLIKGTEIPDILIQDGDTVIVSKLQVGQEQDYDRVLISRTTLPQQTITVRLLVPLTPAGTALRDLNLPNGSTFLDAISALPASDPIRVKTNEIALFRFDAEKGGVVTQTLRPKDVLKGDISQDIPLQDDDIIVVSRTLIGEVFAGFNVLTQPIRDVFTFGNFFQRIFDNNNRGFFF